LARGGVKGSIRCNTLRGPRQSPAPWDPRGKRPTGGRPTLRM